MEGKKQVKRLEVRDNQHAIKEYGIVDELFIDGKPTGIYGGYYEEHESYEFNDQINIKKYPNILEFKVSDIANPLYLRIDFNRDENDFKHWVKIMNLENQIHIIYRFLFDDRNNSLQCKALTLWHRVMSELEYIGFIELEDQMSFDEGNIATNAQKTYTDPTLILGDLIKADVKIIDEVIKRVNK